MGLLDFFRRRSSKTQLSSEQLRDALYAAYLVDDPAKFSRLFDDHQQQIARDIRDWMKVPEPIRQSKTELNAYGEMLGFLLEGLKTTGQQALVDELTRPCLDDPLAKWQAALDESSRLSEQLKYVEAIEILNNALIDNRGLAGSGAERMGAITHGLLGHHCFNCGKVTAARGHYEQALRMCTEQGDAEGILIYHQLLYEIHRYLGEGSIAADYALRCADLHEQAAQADQARYMRSVAKIIRNGEPLLRMVMSLDGVMYEIEDAPRIPEGKNASFHLTRNRRSLQLCTRLVELGIKRAQANQTDAAMEQFREASRVDPYDPDPHHKAGFTLVRAQRYSQAIEEYAQVEQLAPGWFNIRSDLWLAQQLAIGHFPHELFLALYFLEDGTASDEEKLKIADGIIRKIPLALAHLHRGEILMRLKRRSEAATAFEAGLALEAEPDARSRLKAHLAAVTDDPALQARLIEEAQEPGGNLMAATLARILPRQNG